MTRNLIQLENNNIITDIRKGFNIIHDTCQIITKIKNCNIIENTYEGIFIGYYGYMDVIRMSYDGNRLGIHYDGYSNNQYIEYML